jgi:hypothetical protein
MQIRCAARSIFSSFGRFTLTHIGGTMRRSQKITIAEMHAIGVAATNRIGGAPL